MFTKSLVPECPLWSGQGETTRAGGTALSFIGIKKLLDWPA